MPYAFIYLFAGFHLRPGQDISKNLKEVIEVSFNSSGAGYITGSSVVMVNYINELVICDMNRYR